jgi:hypothetical protein
MRCLIVVLALSWLLLFSLYIRFSIFPTVSLPPHRSDQYSCVVSMTNEEPTALQWAFRAGAPRVFAKAGGDDDDDDDAAAAEEKEIPNPEIGVSLGGQRVYPLAVVSPPVAGSPKGSSRPSTSAGANPMLHNTWRVEPASGFLPPREEVSIHSLAHYTLRAFWQNPLAVYRSSQDIVDLGRPDIFSFGIWKCVFLSDI